MLLLWIHLQTSTELWTQIRPAMAHPKVANNKKKKKKNPSRDFKKEMIAKKKITKKSAPHAISLHTHTNTSRAFISLHFFSRNQIWPFSFKSTTTNEIIIIIIIKNAQHLPNEKKKKKQQKFKKISWTVVAWCVILHRFGLIWFDFKLHRFLFVVWKWVFLAEFLSLDESQLSQRGGR